MLNYKPQINLFQELNNINHENNLKKKLQKDIRLTYMSQFDENKKKERLKILQQVQIYIRREEYNHLAIYLETIKFDIKNIKKESDEKIEYTLSGLPKEKGNLENSKDRMTFLQKLVTSHSNGYNPVKNFMEKFRMQSKLIASKRAKDREQRLKFLRNREITRERSQLIKTAERLNKAKLQREKSRIEKLKRDQSKKKKPFITKTQKQDFNAETMLEILTNNKTATEERLTLISATDGKITKNMDFIKSGLYDMPNYDKAIIFKFKLNFNNIIRDKLIELVDYDGDLLLHLNIRNNNLIVINSQIGDKWGKEISIKRTMEGEHEIKILSKNDYYKILDNNKVVTFFIQRKNSKAKYLIINDNIKDFVYKTM